MPLPAPFLLIKKKKYFIIRSIFLLSPSTEGKRAKGIGEHKRFNQAWARDLFFGLLRDDWLFVNISKRKNEETGLGRRKRNDGDIYYIKC